MVQIEAVVRERHSDGLIDLTRWMRATGANLPAASVGAIPLGRHLELASRATQVTAQIDGLIDEGAGLLLLSGTELEVIDRALIALLTSRDAARVARTYRPGIDSSFQWRALTTQIAQTTWSKREALRNVGALARDLGAMEVDLLVHAMLAAARRSTPMIISGIAAVAAALVAQRIDHRTSGWMALATKPSDAAAISAQERLALTCVLSAEVSDELKAPELAIAFAHVSALLAL